MKHAILTTVQTRLGRYANGSYAAVTREVTARRNEGRNSVNVPVTSRGTMLAMSFCVCDVRRYGFTVGSVRQTMLFIFLSRFRIVFLRARGAPRIVTRYRADAVE